MRKEDNPKIQDWKFCKTYTFDELLKNRDVDQSLPTLEEVLDNKTSINNLEDIANYIYFLLDNKEVVYVGQTLCPQKRIPQHRQDKSFTDFAVIKCTSLVIINDFEADSIVLFAPKYNKNLPNNSLYQKIKSLGESGEYKLNTNDFWRIVEKYKLNPAWRDYYRLSPLFAAISKEYEVKDPELKAKASREFREKYLNKDRRGICTENLTQQ